jgi:hypothetical protein
MSVQIILTGDVNLMNVDSPTVPFARVAPLFADAALVFSNLECCLYQPPATHSFHNEGFFADPFTGGETLRQAGIAAVGIANNVNYGEAAILASIKRLDALGIPPQRARRRSSSAPGCALGSCSAARSIGRPTTRPAPTTPASR